MNSASGLDVDMISVSRWRLRSVEQKLYFIDDRGFTILYYTAKTFDWSAKSVPQRVYMLQKLSERRRYDTCQGKCNLLHISTVQLLYTVKEKGGKPDRKPNPLPYGLRNPYSNLRSENSQVMPRNLNEIVRDLSSHEIARLNRVERASVGSA